MIFFVAVAIVIFLGLFLFTLRAYLKKTKLLKRYSKIINIENEVAAIKKESNTQVAEGKALVLLHQKRIRDLIGNFEALTGKHDTLLSLVGELTEQEMFVEMGMYEPKYDFADADEYYEKIKFIREEQKTMIKNKKACYCNTEWEVGGSKSEGKKMTNRTIKLALNAYNVECDNLILKANYKNLEVISSRIDALYKRIEKFIATTNTYISMDFHKLKIKELYVVYEYNEKKQEEKEEQRELREQMREEERVKREFEIACRKAEKEEVDFTEALSKARKEVASKQDAEKEKMEIIIRNLELKLEEAKANKERAMSMAQQTRRGYVYVISNLGSFGNNVFKIGMTRRLEPLDRVRELGDASVPFRFDVHAMIFSEDAPTLEKKLHHEFTKKRVNMINSRKEFFKVSLGEIEKVCANEKLDIKFTKIAEAKEYNQTLLINNEKLEGNSALEERKEVFDISEFKKMA